MFLAIRRLNVLGDLPDHRLNVSGDRHSHISLDSP